MRFTTQKGYGFFEATSAFQKAIRRNDEPVALFFMVEFFNSNYDEYLWKRIKIITSEDVGLAVPFMHATISAMYNAYTDLKKDNKDNKPERMILTNAVLLICRAKKSRLVDYAMIKAWREHDELELPVPDYAYDMHNARGKAMGRGLEHFYNEGAHCENMAEIPGEIEMRNAAFALHKKNPHKLKFPVRKRGDKPDLFNPSAEHAEEE